MSFDLYSCIFSPQAQSVVFVAQELGVDLNIKPIALEKVEHKSPEFLKINPYHTIPTLIDHEKDGLMLFEFRAIMTYLVNKTSPGHKLYPYDPVERALIDQSLFFEAGSLVPAQAAVVCGVFMGRGINREKIAVYETKLKMLDKMLDGKKYLAGGSNRTIADISMMTMLAGESVFKVVDMANYSNIHSWFKNLRVEIPYNDKLEAMMDALKPFTMK